MAQNAQGGTCRVTICFFSAQYLPTAGGVERYTYNLAKRAAADGHRALVVTSALPGLPARETGPEGIEIFRLPVWALMKGRFPVVRKNREFRALEAALFAESIDFAVVNNLFYSLSLHALRQAGRRGVPRLLVNHGAQYLMTGFAPLVWAGKCYEKLAARLARRRCGRFYAVSGEGARWLKTAFGIEADGLLYNAVDPDELAALAGAGEPDWRARLGMPPGAPLVAFAGRMIPEKGALELAQAMRAVRASIPGARCVMAGDGPLREAVSAGDFPGVSAAGPCAYPDTLALIRQADVLALPTRSEGFAGAVLEAAALGTPIVTTATGGSPELMPDPSYGKIIPDRRPETIAAALLEALGDPAWAARAAKKTRARLEARFTWDKTYEALLGAVQGEV